MHDTETTPACPECDGRLRETDTETICEDCGLVLDRDAIDPGPEWRSFEGESEKKRTGAPLTRSRHGRGLSTEIGFGDDSRVTGRKRRQIARMRREHNRAQISSKAERNQVYGFTEIRRIVGRLSLPVNARDQACTLFESAQSEDLFRGPSLEGFAAAAVYATCRTLSVARTVDEVIDVARAEEGELRAAYNALNRELGLPTAPIGPTEYLPRYASQLELDSAVERRAREYATTLLERGTVGGRNPSGVAAACLYAAARNVEDHDAITQSEAAAVADVSAVTIRSTDTDIKEL